MTIKERLYTVDDLLALPDDDKRYELIRGELIEMSPPSRAHALLSSRLLIRLGIFVETNQLGQVTGSDGGYTLHVDPDTVRIPDVSFVTKARASIDTVYHGAPDLAVEVISPSETYTSIGEKLRDYFSAGTHVMWLVYPTPRKVEVYTSAETKPVLLDIEDTLDGGELLPDFKLELHDLFAALDS